MTFACVCVCGGGGGGDSELSANNTQSRYGTCFTLTQYLSHPSATQTGMFWVQESEGGGGGGGGLRGARLGGRREVGGQENSLLLQ